MDYEQIKSGAGVQVGAESPAMGLTLDGLCALARFQGPGRAVQYDPLGTGFAIVDWLESDDEEDGA